MGYFILINYQNNDAEAEKTLQLVQEKGSNGELMKFDVTDPAAITLALGNWASQHPDEYIEVLINNAGIRKDTLKAMENYRLANQKSTRNGIEKAICQITLGNLYFERRDPDKSPDKAR